MISLIRDARRATRGWTSLSQESSMKKLYVVLSATGLLVTFGANAQATKVLDGLRSEARAITQARSDLLADPASPSAATRTVTITPETRYINVAHGDVVAFQSGGQGFAVRFDSAPSVSSFDLQRVAPAGALDHPVTVYVTPSANSGE
jgi:hypothetical protein